jgi:hypothetical protein
MVMSAGFSHDHVEDARALIGLPTYKQAKSIYWKKLQRLVPPAMRLDISHSDLIIDAWNGVRFELVGMDHPERIEGSPIQWFILDEFGNMKPGTWEEHLYPALLETHGGGDIIGVPEGRGGEYWELRNKALQDETDEWQVFHWPSDLVLDKSEIDGARDHMDERTFRQEIGGEFVAYGGIAYYAFAREVHAVRALPYDPWAPIGLCFDFNKKPGYACVVQENCQVQGLSHDRDRTNVIGEVWKDDDSTSHWVCSELIKDWGDHRGDVTCFGDASGGAGGSAKVAGSDWEIIEAMLGNVFGDRLAFDIPRRNPSERSRVNAMNSRLRSVGSNAIRMLIDPITCPHLLNDLEQVICNKDGSVSKPKDSILTHPSDALGYYVVCRHPVISYVSYSEAA